MIGPDAFPPGGVRALLRTAWVTEPTRLALQARLDRRYEAPRTFDAGAFAALKAICDRLIPQPTPAVDIAGALDERLAEGKRNGWRYDVLPSDAEALRLGLGGIDETAAILFGARFTALPPASQDTVLSAVQAGAPPGTAWATLPAELWFEELLVEAAEIYFAHPLSQEAIGYLGMADAAGWSAIGLDEREAEPRTETGGHATA